MRRKKIAKERRIQPFAVQSKPRPTRWSVIAPEQISQMHEARGKTKPESMSAAPICGGHALAKNAA
jgi:hypothetical protein